MLTPVSLKLMELFFLNWLATCSYTFLHRHRYIRSETFSSRLLDWQLLKPANGVFYVHFYLLVIITSPSHQFEGADSLSVHGSRGVNGETKQKALEDSGPIPRVPTLRPCWSFVFPSADGLYYALPPLTKTNFKNYWNSTWTSLLPVFSACPEPDRSFPFQQCSAHEHSC